MADHRLGAFLREKRESLDPERVGISTTARRRTAGLRREEVAQIANVSTDYYSRLEQGRATNPSIDVLDAISSALQLDPANHRHLRRLAGRDTGPTATDSVRPGIVKLLDRIDGLCAGLVLDDVGDILAWNDLATALFVDFASVAPEERNLMSLLVTDEALRRRIPDTERPRVVEALVADFKAQSVRAADQVRVQAVVDRLNQPGTEFADAWASTTIAPFQICIDHVVHPAVGSVRLEVEFLDIADAGQRMVVYHAADEMSEQRVRRLADAARFS